MTTKSELEPKDVTLETAGGASTILGETSAIAGAEEVTALAPIDNSTTRRYSVGLNQHLGKVNLRGDTSAPVGRWDFIALYDKRPPSDPNKGYIDWFYVKNTTSKLTNKTWGSGYYAVYASWDYRAGRYVNVVQVGPTAKS